MSRLVRFTQLLDSKQFIQIFAKNVDMKKVLMIAFNYPPLAGMGMLRSLKFAKYLPFFGWQPAVLTIAASKIKPTPQSQYWFCDESEGLLPQVDIVRTNYVSLKPSTTHLAYLNIFMPKVDRRAPEAFAAPPPDASRPDTTLRDKMMGYLRRFWNNWIEFPDDAVGWYPYAVKGALAYIRHNPVEVIFSTAFPVTSHLIAATVSKKTGIPWVADFRDLWSQAAFRDTNQLRKVIDTYWEVRTVKRASALITVSEPHMEELLQIHKTFDAKNFVIYNGYDADDYNEHEPQVNRPFTITYTGRMYDIDFSAKGRTPAMMFAGIAALFKEKRIPEDRLQCLIYGEHPKKLYDMIAHYGLESIVKCLGGVPFRVAVRAQQQADVLLHLNWDDSDQKGILSGKIFEYLGAKKTILSVPFYNKGVADILRSTQAGVILNSVEACKEQIWRWFQAFEAHGNIPYQGIPERLENYTRKKATEQLAAILNQVSQGKE